MVFYIYFHILINIINNYKSNFGHLTRAIRYTSSWYFCYLHIQYLYTFIVSPFYSKTLVDGLRLCIHVIKIGAPSHLIWAFEPSYHSGSLNKCKLVCPEWKKTVLYETKKHQPYLTPLFCSGDWQKIRKLKERENYTDIF